MRLANTGTDFGLLFGQRHEYAREWKRRTGSKVVGYLCTYVPEEIIYTAGMLPVRILGCPGPQDVTAAHMSSFFCPFSHSVLGAGLTGQYDYLDGLVLANTCLQIRQAFESWTTHRPVPFNYFLHFPYRAGFHAEEWLVGEFEAFRSAIEAWSGQPFSDVSLQQAIAIYNRHRLTLHRLYELRQLDRPRISGQAAMEIVLAGMVMDKQEHTLLLEKYLEDLEKEGGQGLEGVRLMVLGSENDDTQVIEMIEGLGAIVVVDDHCTGSRYFWNMVDQDQEPVAGLAERYLARLPCPTKGIGERRRMDHVLALARQYRVGGAIFLHQKFCNPHQYDFPILEKALSSAGVPSLCLELDVTPSYGQWRTRVEAFLETIGSVR